MLAYFGIDFGFLPGKQPPGCRTRWTTSCCNERRNNVENGEWRGPARSELPR